ncbi:MAG: DUF559 domain-containing protein [Nitrospirota bacterium]
MLHKVIERYIVDFYGPIPLNPPLIKGTEGDLELDGGQHYERTGKEKDKVRDDVLKRTGPRVLRFSDKEVFENIDAVMERIWSYL